MNKKLKYLSFIPLYGTCILLIHLFIMSIKEKISKKKFFRAFIICAVVSAISWYMVMMIVYIISKHIIYFDFNTIGLLITMVIGGYVINVFTFKYFDKKWGYLSCDCEEDKKSFFEVNKKKIIQIAFIFSIVISILVLIIIIA